MWADIRVVSVTVTETASIKNEVTRKEVDSLAQKSNSRIMSCINVLITSIVFNIDLK